MAKVRDRRKRGWFWIDNGVLDDHGAELGAYAIATYAVLCRHASNDDGCCQISMGTIARKIGCSRAQVKRELHKLEERGFIEVVHVREGAIQHASEYYILDTPPPYLTDPGSGGPGVTEYPGVVSDRPEGRVTQSHLNKDSFKKDLKLKTGHPPIAQLNEWMAVVRSSTAAPSLLVEVGRLGEDALDALRTHALFAREIDRLEEERGQKWIPQ